MCVSVPIKEVCSIFRGMMKLGINGLNIKLMISHRPVRLQTIIEGSLNILVDLRFFIGIGIGEEFAVLNDD